MILKILAIIFIILILVVVIAGIYLYYFHVFKTIRVCVSNESTNTNLSCSNNQQCISLASGISSFNAGLESMPNNIKEKFNEIMNSSVYCENTCKIKKIYGTGIGDDKEVESCNNDQEITFDIRGKEGVKIISYLKKNS